MSSNKKDAAEREDGSVPSFDAKDEEFARDHPEIDLMLLAVQELRGSHEDPIDFNASEDGGETNELQDVWVPILDRRRDAADTGTYRSVASFLGGIQAADSMLLSLSYEEEPASRSEVSGNAGFKTTGLDPGDCHGYRELKPPASGGDGGRQGTTQVPKPLPTMIDQLRDLKQYQRMTDTELERLIRQGLSAPNTQPILPSLNIGYEGARQNKMPREKYPEGTGKKRGYYNERSRESCTSMDPRYIEESITIPINSSRSPLPHFEKKIIAVSQSETSIEDEETKASIKASSSHLSLFREYIIAVSQPETSSKVEGTEGTTSEDKSKAVEEVSTQ